MKGSFVAAFVAALVAAFALVGAGTAQGSTWPPATCKAQANKVAYWSDFMLRHYGGMVYPADVSYLQLRHALARYVGHRCSLRALGKTLRTELTPRRRARLLALLPKDMERTLRRALAASA